MLLLLINQLSARINIQQNKKTRYRSGFFIVCFTPNRSRVNRDISLKGNIDASRSIALGTLHLGMRCYLRRYIWKKLENQYVRDI
tara:strand:- start:19772 stop:20026 length:255 start_codon:yes stop_codon:yes gene_type:complete